MTLECLTNSMMAATYCEVGQQSPASQSCARDRRVYILVVCGLRDRLRTQEATSQWPGCRPAHRDAAKSSRPRQHFWRVVDRLATGPQFSEPCSHTWDDR